MDSTLEKTACCRSPHEVRAFPTRVHSPLTSFGLLQRGLLQLSVVLIFAVVASAQTTGGLKGKVKNLEGNGIGGATVTARLDGKDIRTVTANNRGDFTLEPLDAGIYNIVFDAKGYAAAVKYKVEVKPGKTKDLGGGLILMVDRGMQVIVEGSVYYKDGTSLAGAEVKIERVNADGSTSKFRTMFAGETGEVVLRQGEGKAKFRFTATHKGVSGSKEIEVDGAARYRFSIILDVERERKPSNL